MLQKLRGQNYNRCDQNNTAKKSTVDLQKVDWLLEFYHNNKRKYIQKHKLNTQTFNFCSSFFKLPNISTHQQIPLIHSIALRLTPHRIVHGSHLYFWGVNVCTFGWIVLGQTGQNQGKQKHQYSHQQGCVSIGCTDVLKEGRSDSTRARVRG